jgi:hypothetical protein
MTIQDVIDNDLIQDIRTGTAADDSVEMIGFPGDVFPNHEYSNSNRSWFGFTFSAYANCNSVLEFGAWKDGFRSLTRIVLESKSTETKYFGVSDVDVSHVNNDVDVILFETQSSINQMLEFWTYTSLLAPGGLIVVHDVHYHPGPKTLIENLDPDKFKVDIRCNDKVMDYGLAFITRK